MTSVTKPMPISALAAPVSTPNQVGGCSEARALASDEQNVRMVTVALDPGEKLERFLTLLVTTTARRLVIVIADNSTKHNVVTAAAQWYGAHVVGDGTNLGYGAGANLAAADLEKDWITVVNPDPVWRPGGLDILIDAGLANPTAGCLGPLLLNPGDIAYPSGRALPSLVKGAGHAVLGRMWPANPFSAAYHTADQGGSGGSRTMGWPSGAYLPLPAAAWRRLEGFGDDYFMFFEDVDLEEQAGRAGWLNVQASDSVVAREQGASWKARPGKMIRAHHTSARHYPSGVYNAPWQAPVRWLLSGGLRLREELEVRAPRN